MADHDAGLPPRAWQRMLSGRRLDLLAPDPADIEIEDIAHGLARVARWNGQTRGGHVLSVAQHSCMVEEITRALAPGWPPAWRLASLLHDAPEYVIGDLISPFKAVIGRDYYACEARLLAAVHARFGLATPLAEEARRLIKSADRIAAHFESVALAGFDPAEARQLFGDPAREFDLPEALVRQLEATAAWPTATAMELFLERFRELSGAVA